MYRIERHDSTGIFWEVVAVATTLQGARGIVLALMYLYGYHDIRVYDLYGKEVSV
jgi:hypothetical protein